MRAATRSFFLVVGLVVLSGQPALAQTMYRCTGANGTTAFQQKPCEARAAQSTVSVKHPSAAPIVVSGAAAAPLAARGTMRPALGCRLLRTDVPDQIDVMAVTTDDAAGHPSAGFAIHDSGAAARLVDAVVNAPGRDVALMLSARGPTVWNLRWTPTTRIHTVWASGVEHNVVAGVTRTTRVVTGLRTSARPTDCGAFAWKGGSRGAFDGADTLSMLAFGRPVTRMIDLGVARRGPGRTVPMADGATQMVPEGAFVIGAPLPAGAPTQTSTDVAPAVYAPMPRARADESGLNALVRSGALRPARRADMDAWLLAWLAKRDLPPVRDPEALAVQRFQRPGDPLPGAWVVQAAVQIPDERGSHVPWTPSASMFIVPDGVPMPTGAVDKATVFDMRALTCRGHRCPPQVQGHAVGEIPLVKASCALPWAGNKPPSRVYAATAVGRPTGLRLEDSMVAASVTDVIVNDPGHDVGLVLTAPDHTDQRIWNIRWTRGTRIVAVYARGASKPVVRGVPSSAAVLALPSHDAACPKVELSPHGLTRINMAVRAVFGQPAALAVMSVEGVGLLHLGAPLGAGAVLDGGVPGRHRDILTGGVADRIQLALDDAESRGELRRPTQGDLRAYANAWRRNRGHDDVPDEAQNPHPMESKAYLVVGRFTLPAGMGASAAHRGTWFIVPRGTPLPGGPREGVDLIEWDALPR